jgi:hypothetical protein
MAPGVINQYYNPCHLAYSKVTGYSINECNAFLVTVAVSVKEKPLIQRGSPAIHILSMSMSMN